MRLQPILPVVFYTGTRPWPTIPSLVELIEEGETFRDVTPTFRPLFVNLPDLSPEQLQGTGGPFGWVLELVRGRRSRPEEFRELLNRVVHHLESIAAAERLRWLELLSYVEALVYHERATSEHPELQQTITDSVQTDQRRKEVSTVRRTMAQELMEKGERRADVKIRRETLLLLLRQRFGDVPETVEKLIKSTKDVDRLNAWLTRFANASTWTDMGFDQSSQTPE